MNYYFIYNKTDLIMQKKIRSRIFRIMKLTSLLLLTALLQISATAYSQATKFELQMENATIKEMFKAIEAQSEFRFFYSDDLSFINQRKTVEVNNATVESILDHILDQSDLTYRIFENNLIVVTPLERTLITQQGIAITGTVTDADGEPLPGASVMVKGTAQGTTADVNGTYSLTVADGNAVLSVSYVGYVSQEIAVGNRRTINVTLSEDTRVMEEVVVVGYGTQRRGNVTGSIATVNSAELTKAPITSTTNALAGRLPGLISQQSSGLPGSDAASLNIRGLGRALVIVDGIETSFNNIDANQIETISILKDGSASIYGARASNGVILVTTKRGNTGKPTIALNVTGGLQGVTMVPKPVNAGQYVELLSEAHLNRGLPAIEAPYTPEEIRKYYEGTDPTYPNTDWYNVLMRNWAPQQQYNLSLRGGNEAVRYYGFIGYVDQGTMYKKNGGGYKRYNFQSNVDARITKNLSMELTVSGIYDKNERTRKSLSNGGSFWQDYWNTLPIYPASFPDPTKVPYAFGAGSGGAHVTTNRDISGYDDTDNYYFKGTMAFNYKFDFIEGLSAKMFVHYGKNMSSNKQFFKPVHLYTYDPQSGLYNHEGSLNTSAELYQTKSDSRTIQGYFSLNYDRVFADKHHITAMALYEAIDSYGDWISARRINFFTTSIEQLSGGSTEGWSNNGGASQGARVSYVGRLNYAFMQKYILETILRADASANYRSDVRWGYFPSVSLGWRLSEENFIKNIGFIDNLKLRVSHGRSGDDSVASFQFLSGYNLTNSYFVGTEPLMGIVSTGIANPYLTWMESAISNLGIDFAFFKNKLYGEFDVFYRELTGIPRSRISTLPSSFGATLPQENIDSQSTRGFELQLGTAGQLNNGFSYDISGNISWSRSKWIHYEEPEYDDPDQERISKRSGRWTDRVMGYKSDGLFTTQWEIDNLPFDQDQRGNVTLRPGSVKYVNINGDDILDWRDQIEIGKGTTPHWMFGFNINLKYKNLDFSSLFQGAFGYFHRVEMIYGLVKPQVYYDLRWTPENNNPKALVPRVDEGGGGDFYYKNAGYLRLKNASLGYNLPNDILQKINVQQARIYLAGTNLITFDKLKKYQIDPEAPSGQSGIYYPQQRTISLGLNLSF